MGAPIYVGSFGFVDFIFCVDVSLAGFSVSSLASLSWGASLKAVPNGPSRHHCWRSRMRPLRAFFT